METQPALNGRVNCSWQDIDLLRDEMRNSVLRWIERCCRRLPNEGPYVSASQRLESILDKCEKYGLIEIFYDGERGRKAFESYLFYMAHEDPLQRQVMDPLQAMAIFAALILGQIKWRTTRPSVEEVDHGQLENVIMVMTVRYFYPEQLSASDLATETMDAIIKEYDRYDNNWTDSYWTSYMQFTGLPEAKEKRVGMRDATARKCESAIQNHGIHRTNGMRVATCMADQLRSRKTQPGKVQSREDME